MTETERAQAVVSLWQQGFPNQEIARRTGIRATEIRLILREHGHLPQPAARYGLAVPRGCTPEQAGRVRRLIVTRITDPNEACDLLLALGLVAPIPTAKRAAG